MVMLVDNSYSIYSNSASVCSCSGSCPSSFGQLTYDTTNSVFYTRGDTSIYSCSKTQTTGNSISSLVGSVPSVGDNVVFTTVQSKGVVIYDQYNDGTEQVATYHIDDTSSVIDNITFTPGAVNLKSGDGKFF